MWRSHNASLRVIIFKKLHSCDSFSTWSYKSELAVILSNHIAPHAVGHVPFLYSSKFKKFLSLPNYTIKVLVTGNRISRSTRYDLEIPVEYVFNGNKKFLQWAKKYLDNTDANVNIKVGRCLK